MSHPLSRRSFLIGTAALAAGAACATSKKGADINVARPDAPADKKQKRVLSFVPAGSMYQTGLDERVTFALFEGVPASLIGEKAVVRVAFLKEGETKFSEPIVPERKFEGIEQRPYYVTHHRFESPGRYTARAVVDGHDPGDAAIEVIDPASAAWPVPGTPLPKVPTPTAADPLGVNPICTRTPACPWHEQSLDAVLGNGKPTLVLLATPALCKSQTCGPVLDILLGERASFEAKANVVHVEVYTDLTGNTLSPAFAAFKTDSEPVLYLTDKDGVLVERFNGPYDRSEAKGALARLLG